MSRLTATIAANPVANLMNPTKYCMGSGYHYYSRADFVRESEQVLTLVVVLVVTV